MKPQPSCVNFAMHAGVISVVEQSILVTMHMRCYRYFYASIYVLLTTPAILPFELLTLCIRCDKGHVLCLCMNTCDYQIRENEGKKCK